MGCASFGEQNVMLYGTHMTPGTRHTYTIFVVNDLVIVNGGVKYFLIPWVTLHKIIEKH